MSHLFLCKPEVFWVGVQALCALAAFVGLVAYTTFTYGIRKASIRQATAAQRPFIVVMQPEPGIKNCYFVKNMGNGPALRMAWKSGFHNEPDGVQKHWNRIGALAVDDWSFLPDWNNGYAVLKKMPKSGLRIHYEDLAGNYYCTVVPERDVVSSLQDCITISKKECHHLPRKAKWYKFDK